MLLAQALKWTAVDACMDSSSCEVCVCGLTLTVCVCVAEGLQDEFSVQPGDVEVAEGEVAVLNCAPPVGHPEPNVMWKKDGLRINSTDHHYTVSTCTRCVETRILLVTFPMLHKFKLNMFASQRGILYCPRHYAGERAGKQTTSPSLHFQLFI